LESEFCISALELALSLGKPNIFNTDQGSQFTSIDFTKILLNAGAQISMDGKGRVFDNIFSSFFSYRTLPAWDGPRPFKYSLPSDSDPKPYILSSSGGYDVPWPPNFNGNFYLTYSFQSI